MAGGDVDLFLAVLAALGQVALFVRFDPFAWLLVVAGYSPPWLPGLVYPSAILCLFAASLPGLLH